LKIRERVPMSLGKLYAEDVVGGAITSFVGTAIIAFAQQHQPLNLETFLLVAILLFGVFYLVKFLTRWLFFVFMSGLREACGVFIEIYVTEKHGHRIVVIAPMVVYFDARADMLAITGHAFEIVSLAKAQFESYANWQSIVTHHKRHKDDIGVFYLHDGDLVGEAANEIPGTTYCRLPKPTAKRFRQGYFCDLVQVNRSLDEERDNETEFFLASYFEVIRASAEMERAFHNLISRRIERLMCHLKLASPREDAYAMFVKRYGGELITSESVERGPIMRKAKDIVVKGTA
jgi:hypothetical protein